jgi:hypothetical protein
VVQGIVDSVFPIDEEIRRFVATLDSVPTALRHGAGSRDELVQRFIRAVETRDTTELPRLVIQRDEFIIFYYPHTRYTERPYELAPALLWFQMENPSSRGLNRLLERLGGRSLGYEGLSCPDAPRIEERNRIWDGLHRAGPRTGPDCGAPPALRGHSRAGRHLEIPLLRQRALRAYQTRSTSSIGPASPPRRMAAASRMARRSRGQL